MNIKEIISNLKHFDGTFPKAVLAQAVKQRAEAIPELLKVVRNAEKEAREFAELESFIMHIYAMFLLAQFREKQAYPLIIDFFSIPSEKAFELGGDLSIEDLGRILASVSGGDTTRLETLIEDRDASELIRSAAIEALLILVAVGEKSREDIVAYFKDLFHYKIERVRSLVWDSLVACSIDLYPEEVFEEICKSYDDGLVDEAFVGLDEIEAVLEVDKEEALDSFARISHYRLIENAIAELAELPFFGDNGESSND